MTQPTATQQRTRWWLAPQLRLGLAVILMVVAVGIFLANRSDAATNNDITLQGADVPGGNTFTPSIADPAPAPASALTAPQPSTAGIVTAKADAQGLYGGTRNGTNCNTTALVQYLETNANRARPWAGALGIASDDIRAYVGALTPVVARVDTRVTDYGFADGRAVPRQVVLQAGTDVLVDRAGLPRVRCASGNPLGPPQPISGTPDYRGPRWAGFSPATIVVVVPASTPVILILVDIRDLAIFVRLPGSIVIIDLDRGELTGGLVVLEAGQRARLTGRNWPAGTAVTLTFDNPAVTLATVNADGAGSIAADVTIPPAAAPGQHTVTFTGGGFTVTQTVYVIPRAPTARVSAV
ncbi:MAG TPA: DUF6777 domain-containing protein [Acidimicrobiales bacterium]|nr:DUF6777 domain-containing protein [Acidimicrobiales bacterium]